MFREVFLPIMMGRMGRMELRSILHLVADGHNCIKCTKADVRLRTPNDGQKDCPKHVESQYQ